MNKSISIMLAGAAFLSSAVSCGKGDSSSASSQELSGDYFTMINLDDQPALITGDVDDYISGVLSKNVSYNIQPAESYVKQVEVIFDSGRFRGYQTFGKMMTVVFSGKFSENDKKIVFSYEKYETKTQTGDIESVSADEEPVPCDEDIVTGKKQVSDELYIAETKKKIRNTWIEQLRDMNREGGYLSRISPSVYSADIPFDFVPAFYALNNKRGDPPISLYHLGDLLGYATYGLNVRGEYVQGGDFVLDFDQLAVYNDDPFSPCKHGKNDENPEKSIEDIEKKIRADYKISSSDAVSSAISFSDGKWEWKNSSGSLLNNGSYQESKKYPGLIAMYTDSSSKRKESEFSLDEGYATLMLYIADDGKVYYPYFAKIS